MNDAQAKALAGLSALVDKVALELVFAIPGSDSGLLPINSFLNDMEEATLSQSLPQAATEAVAKAREIIDDIFLSTGQFTRESLDLLNAWAPWFQTVVSALLVGKAPLPFTPGAAPNRIATPPAQPGTESMEKPLLLDLENDREVLLEFVNESREHLQNIESGVLVLEEHPGDSDTLNSIFRAFHTFKGGSGFLNLTPMNKLAHELESLLDLARQDRIQITSDVSEIILNGGDMLKRFVDAIELQLSGQVPQGPIVIPTAALRERVAQAIAKPVQLAPENSEGQTAFINKAVGAAAENKTEEPNPKPEVRSPQLTVKVDTLKLDTLIDMVGEMVIAQSLVAQDADIKGLGSPRLSRNLAQLARTTKDLQRTAMALRMVPISGAFRKMNRLVRDLSQRSGKQAELILDGEDTELDRNIVEEIHDPLVHMIRNSVDHGIEPSTTRVANGKAPIGRITLSAQHQGGNFVIQIKDDGAGLNREKILKKASEQGIVAPGVELTEKEIFNLIFEPGFSTADAITDISGRGVGMDVVRRNIEQLRGKIEIDSKPGLGTTISLFLPLTLAIIDGLIVRVGEDRYILPTLSVRESFRPTPNMLSTVRGKGEIVNVRGRLLPLLRLNNFLSGRADDTDPTQAVVVVAESEGAERCVLVDELIGKQEVVIKSLGETFHSNPLLAGAAILGDGRVGLILDVHALVHPKPISFSKAA